MLPADFEDHVEHVGPYSNTREFQQVRTRDNAPGPGSNAEGIVVY